MTALQSVVRRLLILFPIAVGLACNLPLNTSDPGSPDPVGPIIHVTATPPATETPTPSPSPQPVITLQAGEIYLRNGDYDAALLAFQNVVTNPGASAEQLVSAHIGLGKAAMKRGDFGSARASLDTVINQFSSDPRLALAYFLRGDALAGLGDYGAAISDYRAYLSLKSGLIDSYVYERLGDSYLALGQSAEATQAYDQAIAAGRYTAALLRLREKVALVQRGLGNYSAALAQYQAILQVAQIENYRASIDFYIAQTLFEAGRTDEAYVQFQHVFMMYPANVEALSSLRALLEAEYPVDQFQRGMVNYYQGQYDIAVEALLNYLAATPFDDVNPAAHLYIAYSYRALGNLQAAGSELQGLLTFYDSDDGEVWADAWLERADVLAALGQPDESFRLYDLFIEDYRSLPQVPDALYQAGRLAESLGDYNRALAYYQRLAAEFPSDTRVVPALFRIGLLAYRGGDLASAETLFSTTAGLPANERPATSYLWLGKTYIAAGNTDAANTALNNAIAADGPRSYYGLRAADLAANRPPFIAPASTSFPADPEEGRAEAEQWLISTFGLGVAPPLAASLRADLVTDPRMIRGRELWDLGLQVDAKQDFEAVRADFVDDPLASYQLAIYFRDIGLFRSSVLAARNLHRLANIGALDGPLFLARLRYPTYYSELILPAAQQYGLDPLFIYAMIWQESTFEGFAVSTAAAQGLMQIWPPTGADIAGRLAWPGYQPADLQRPVVSVAFGTWLVNEEFDRFGGDPFAVLTAYNAGPGNTATWKEAAGGDYDLFTESITLREPKLYVQLIYEHYTYYKALYGTP